jgi:CDP-glycerol glycerophosphotransferase
MAPGLRTQVRALPAKLRRAARYERTAWFRRLPIRADTVFYESFSGNGMLCNPEAIFRALLASDDMGHLTHVWALSDFRTYASTISEFIGDPRVKFVRVGSAAYHSALATSKYLINNATFQSMFAKRAGQIYVDTWHGTPLKAMGYDVPNGGVATRNVVRNFLLSDYLLAPNDTTEDMYLRAYRMTNVFSGGIIRAGTPRVDKQFAPDGDRARTLGRLRAAGVEVPTGRRVVLYAPTWRGDFYAPTNDVRHLKAYVEELKERVDLTADCLLLKVHQQIYQFAAADPQLRSMLVPNHVPANDVLAVTDVLVTDYSSIFVDFLATGRPVLFFAPDLDDYTATRGLNAPPDEWPGPVSLDVDDLARRLEALGTGAADDVVITHASVYAAARERYCGNEDGQAAQRVIDVVFRGRDGHDVRRGFTDGRSTVLMYLGGVLPNGITASGLSLLDNIDYERFDVSVFYSHTTRPDRAELIDLVHPSVRLLPRSGGMLASKLQVRTLKTRGRRAARSHSSDVVRFRQALREEWVRCFGETRFDFVVDFSGYSPLWDKILLQGDAKSFSVWLHNDLHADAKREVDGRFLHRANLQGIFDLYEYADHLVSVSPALAEVNRKKLAKYADEDKFTYARNTINHRRVLHLAYGDRPQPPDPDRTTEEIHPIDLRASIDRLMAYHDVEAIVEEADRRARIEQIVPAAPDMKTFVTAGRLSPEKNHVRLVRAFDAVHLEYPDTRLVILGAGPLQASLEQLVRDLGLNSAITLAGHQANPYGVMAESDCFVLSSDYEGQPMVLLEALVLGLPVVTTAFASVKDALPDGCGLVVDTSVGALAEGMLAYLRGDVPNVPFDYVEYNRQATEEFYRAIGAG